MVRRSRGQGVDEDEGLAFFQSVSDSPHLFRHEQPPNTSGLARHLDDVFYVACRWDYQRTPKGMLRGQTRNALVRENGKEFLAFPADWGPHEDTHRVARSQSVSVSCVGIPSVPVPIAGAGLPGLILARWPEERLSFRRNSIPDFWFRLSELPSWCLISHSQYKLGGNALHTIRKTRRWSHTNLAESPNAVCLNGVCHDGDGPNAASPDASSLTTTSGPSCWWAGGLPSLVATA